MIHQPRAEHSHLSTPISPVRTIPRSQKSNVETRRIKSQSDTHLGITIRGGRRPSAGRAAASAAKITTSAPQVILVGWSGC